MPGTAWTIPTDGGWRQTAHLVAVSKVALTRVNAKRLDWKWTTWEMRRAATVSRRPRNPAKATIGVEGSSLTDSLRPRPVQSLVTIIDDGRNSFEESLACGSFVGHC